MTRDPARTAQRKSLLVYDAPLRLEALPEQPEAERLVFPLREDSALLARVTAQLAAQGAPVVCLDSARVLEAVLDETRQAYVDFVGRLPDAPGPFGVPLARWLSGDRRGTLWWLGLVADKNPFKSTTLNRLAQQAAVARSLEESGAQALEVCLLDQALAESLEQLARSRNVAFRNLRPAALPPSPGPLAVLRGLLRLARYFRGLMGQPGHPLPAPGPNELTILTYFPNYDRAAASQGRYLDGYYRALQQALLQRPRPPAFLAVNLTEDPAELDAARRLATADPPLTLLGAFFTPGMALGAALTLFLGHLRFRLAEGRIARLHVLGGANVYALFRHEWQASFSGYAGLAGLLYLRLFRAALRRLKPERCLFLYEGYALERALIMARDEASPRTRLLGYQHGTVSPMYTGYFPGRGGCPEGAPFPDELLCNGPAPLRLLLALGWPEGRLRLVEGLRYQHLRELARTPRAGRPRALLVLFSISPDESRALLASLCEAFGRAEDLPPGLEIWLKPHPFLPPAGLAPEGGLPEHFQLREEPLDELLPGAAAALSGETGAGLEAYAASAVLLCALSPGWMNMSPMRGRSAPGFATVCGAREFRDAVRAVLAGELAAPTPEQRLALVEDFFCQSGEAGPLARFLEALDLDAGERPLARPAAAPAGRVCRQPAGG